MRAADGGARLCLTVECADEEGTWREALSLYTARLSKMPVTGEISAEQLAFYRRENAVGEALSLGLRSLSYSTQSEELLVQKLCRKGAERGAAREAVRELSKRGLLVEEDAAVREAERGLSKLWGNKRILAEIRAKGYGEAAFEAARVRLEKEDGVLRCKKLLAKRRMARMPADVKEASRVMAFLVRYGYSAAEIRAAFSQN